MVAVNETKFRCVVFSCIVVEAFTLTSRFKETFQCPSRFKLRVINLNLLNVLVGESNFCFLSLFAHVGMVALPRGITGYVT
jgi:hypothetical protein